MRNKYFADETIGFDDIYFVCYMIERTARRLKQRNIYVATRLGVQGLEHELSVSSTTHSMPAEQIVDEWIEAYALEAGEFDITAVDKRLAPRIPSPTQMGKVYARLISAVSDEDNLPQTFLNVYGSPICETIDNYNASAFYEPSYVIERAYRDGEFFASTM